MKLKIVHSDWAANARIYNATNVFARPKVEIHAREDPKASDMLTACNSSARFLATRNDLNNEFGDDEASKTFLTDHYY